MSDQLWWYATRAAGLMTWATATAAVVLGLLLSTRAVRNRTGPWFLDLHRFLGGISVVFLLAHIVTLWADSFVEFGPKEILVPGASEWRTEAIAWGIIAGYLLVAVEVTSLFRRRMRQSVWRAVHLTSFIVMIAGSYHAWTAGSDVDNPITWAIAGVGCLLVFFLVAMRLQRLDPDEMGGGGIIDNRQILEEMRARLEALPVPESTLDAQLTPDTTPALPRRAPVDEDLPGIDEAAPAAPSLEGGSDPFDPDPFAAVPRSLDESTPGDWAEPSPADPFADTSGPFADTSGPFADTGGPFADTGDPFADTSGPFADTGDPFADTGVASDTALDEGPGADLADDGPGSPLESATLEEPPDLFATTAPPPPPVPADPFAAFDPPPAVVTEPAPLTGPPPLPDEAVDPLTGEPDQAAYTAWLKDWLEFAERYGDETPDDPTRVES